MASKKNKVLYALEYAENIKHLFSENFKAKAVSIFSSSINLEVCGRLIHVTSEHNLSPFTVRIPKEDMTFLIENTLIQEVIILTEKGTTADIEATALSTEKAGGFKDLINTASPEAKRLREAYGKIASCLIQATDREPGLTLEWLEANQPNLIAYLKNGSTDNHSILDLWIGRGKGLTPSGDDILIGLMVVLCAYKKTKAMTLIDAYISKFAVERTTRVSYEYLYYASKGLYGKALTALINSISKKEGSLTGEDIEAVLFTGHTSGADTLYGILIGIKFVLEDEMEKSKKVVVALGGNAILKSGQKPEYQTQLDNVIESAVIIAEMIKKGYDVVLGHGNGPQVGSLVIQNEAAKDTISPMPMDVLNAQTQGFIGYMMVQSIANELHKKGISKNIVSLLTRVLVSKDDMGFITPTKPIGIFYSEQEAKYLSIEKGWHMAEDSGRGYRRLVPSPAPLKILESKTILSLVESGTCVIASGGGGIPVVENSDGTYEGIEAVIDKDLSCAKMAKELDADVLMLLTDVSNVYVNFGKPDQKALENVTVAELEKHIADGQFSKGSMGPKIEAAVDFVRTTGGTAYICSLSGAADALIGTCGTAIRP